MQMKIHYKRARETRAILVERFPNVFAAKGAAKRPLRLGIHVDIIRACPDLSIRDVRNALADYTSGFKYLEGTVAGVKRIGLDGNAYEPVTERQGANANARMEAMRKARTEENARQQSSERAEDAPSEPARAA